MKKRILFAFLGMLMMPLAVSQALAVDETVPSGIVDVGNKVCPVMGGAVDGEHFVVYEGKRYGLCCPGCKAAFLADPEKYIAAMQQVEAAEAVIPQTDVVPATVSGSEETERAMEQRSL